MLADAAKTNKRVFVNKAQGASLTVKLHLGSVSEIDLERIVLDKQLLDEASLIESIGASKEKQSFLVLEG